MSILVIIFIILLVKLIADSKPTIVTTAQDPNSQITPAEAARLDAIWHAKKGAQVSGILFVITVLTPIAFYVYEVSLYGTSNQGVGWAVGFMTIIHIPLAIIFGITFLCFLISYLIKKSAK
jgi:hypothetical protein